MSPHGAMGGGAADRVIFLPALHIGGLYAIAILGNCEFPIRVLPMESEFSVLCATGAKLPSAERPLRRGGFG